MITTTHIIIAVVAAIVVGVAIRLYRARNETKPIGQHDALIKRAEPYTEQSAFLRKVCAEYRANRHLSARQVEAIEDALERLANRKSRATADR